MSTKAWLDGRQSDLETLAFHFSATDPAVGRSDDGRYYLASLAFDALFSDGGGLHQAASAILSQLNGLARVLESDFRPVRPTGTFEDTRGRRHTVVLAEAALVAASALNVGAPSTPAPDFIRVADNHPDVAEALAILGNSSEYSWRDLYTVYEIVRENVGGTNKGRAKQILIGKNWLSGTEIDAFDDSANTKAISGDAARHARGQAKTPHSMTLEEGRSAIRTLVRRWLDTLRTP